MPYKLWERCLTCPNNCCHGYLSKSIFTTPAEKKALPLINRNSPCAYLDKKNLCSVHTLRPFDCRLFPFDLIKDAGKFYWVIWDLNCPILKNERDRFEEYLLEHETTLIPKFKDFLEEFNDWRDAEYKARYKYEILRELIIR